MNLKLVLASALAAFSLPTHAYDADLARKLDAFYGKLTFEAFAHSTIFLKPEAFVEAIQKDPSIVVIDIRTPEEQAFIRSGYKNTLPIPLSELFDAKNLDRIPSDKRLVILCHSATRAFPAALNLKMLGFANVQVLEQGIVGMAQVSSPKTCPTK
jgi:rhodanese-related sulfurtransferase